MICDKTRDFYFKKKKHPHLQHNTAHRGQEAHLITSTCKCVFHVVIGHKTDDKITSYIRNTFGVYIWFIIFQLQLRAAAALLNSIKLLQPRPNVIKDSFYCPIADGDYMMPKQACCVVWSKHSRMNNWNQQLAACSGGGGHSLEGVVSKNNSSNDNRCTRGQHPYDWGHQTWCSKQKQPKLAIAIFICIISV